MYSLEYYVRSIHTAISMHDANTRMCTTGTDLLFKSNEIINTHKNITNRMFTLNGLETISWPNNSRQHETSS